MSKTNNLHSTSNLSFTGDSLLSAPSSPLPMSIEVLAPDSYPPFSYCNDNPKANDQLIQKATTRLRCRLLHQGLVDAKSKVSHLQEELDNLRIELSTTENVLSKFGEPDDRQLLALERRFNTHQQQLDLLLSSSTVESQSKPTPQLQENAITASTSFSSTLSRMSSVFSTRHKPFKKTTTPAPHSSAPFGFDLQQLHSDSSVTNDSCSATEYDNDLHHTGSDWDTREKRTRRRQRVKQLSQEYQQRLRTYDPTWKEDGGHDWRPAPSVVANNNKDARNKPTTTHQPEQQRPAKMQQSHALTTTATATNTIEKKRTSAKQTLNTTKKPMMTSTKPIQPSKPAAAPCLCKRNKTTNKADPFKAAPSPHSPTSHSREPEMVLLETQKHPLSPLPAETVAKYETTYTTSPPEAHVLALSPSTAPVYHDDDPPRSSNVSDWLMKQHQYHLQQQRHDNNNNGDDHDRGEEDTEEAWMKKETLIDNHPLNGTVNIGNNNNDSMKPVPSRTGTQSKQQQQSSSVFDDVLRYLDNMSDFGNDSGLQQDISHLLAPMYNSDSNNNRAPSTYSSSSSMSSIYSSLSWSTAGSQAHWSSLLTNHGMVGKYFSRYLVDSVNKSLSWCKFLSVLSLALMISLGRGPNHMLLSLDDLDYLSLMADQGEPLVYSYYL